MAAYVKSIEVIPNISMDGVDLQVDLFVPLSEKEAGQVLMSFLQTYVINSDTMLVLAQKLFEAEQKKTF